MGYAKDSDINAAAVLLDVEGVEDPLPMDWDAIWIFFVDNTDVIHSLHVVITRFASCTTRRPRETPTRTHLKPIPMLKGTGTLG